MRCFLRLLAATVTALLLMSLHVESQPAYDNAPVALLLPNGTIVMAPGTGKSGAMKTSLAQHQNHQKADSSLLEASSAGPKQINKLGKKFSVDHQFNQPQMRGCMRVRTNERNPLYFHQHEQLTQPLCQISTGVNTNSALLDSVEEWVKKPCNNPSEHSIPKAIQLSPKAGRRFENDQIREHSELSPETGEQDFVYKNYRDLMVNAGTLNTSGRLHQSDVQLGNRNISAVNTKSMSNNEEPHNNYLNFNPTTRNEISQARPQRILGMLGGIRHTVHKEESNNRLPPRNALGSSNEVISKACRRRLHDRIGVSDRVERGFDFRNSEDLSSNNADKSKVDTSEISNQADVRRYLGIYAGSPCKKYTAKPFYGSNDNISAEKEPYCRRTGPRLHDSLLDIDNKKKASNGYIRLRLHSNSNFVSERKGNSEALRLHLKRRNLINNNIPSKNKKSNLEGSEKHFQNVEKLIRRRPDALHEKNACFENRPESKALSENNETRRKYHKRLDDKVSNLNGVADFSRGELETPPPNNYLSCKPTQSAARDVAHGKRAIWPELEEHNFCRDEAFQRANVQETASDFCCMLGTNMDDVSKNSRRRSMETGSADVLEETNFPSWSRSQKRQTSSPQTKRDRLDCHRMENLVRDCVSQDIYNCNIDKSVEAETTAHKCLREYPRPSGNDNTLWPSENYMIELKSQQPTMYYHENCNSDGILEDNLGYSYSTSGHKTGVNVEAGNRRITCSSFNEPHNRNNYRHPIDGKFGLHLLIPGNGVCCNHQIVYKQQHPSIIECPRTYQHNTYQGIAPVTQFTTIVPPHLQVLHYTSSTAESASTYGSLQRLPMFLNQCPTCRASRGNYVPCFPSDNLTSPTTRRTQSTDPLVRCNGFPWMVFPLHTTISTDHHTESWFLPSFPLPTQQMSFATFVKDEDNFWKLIHYETIL